MKLRKRYFLMISLAILPFYKFFHFEDYCYGDKDLVIIGMLSVPFVIALIATTFHNLYTVSERKELFNYRPLIIGLVFFIFMFIGLQFHENSLLKNKIQSFQVQIKDANDTKLILFGDDSFEFRSTFHNYGCVNKGTYFYKGDSLYIDRADKKIDNSLLDSVYFYNKAEKTLTAKNKLLPNFILKKTNR
jgi:hypothetical protein